MNPLALSCPPRLDVRAVGLSALPYVAPYSGWVS